MRIIDPLHRLRAFGLAGQVTGLRESCNGSVGQDLGHFD